MKRINIILLITLATLITACSILNDPPQPQRAGGNAITDGLAEVRVNIGTNARMVFPDFDWNFSKYMLSAAPAGDNTNDAPSPVELGGNSDWGYINVPYGEWIITVTAYVKVSGTDYAAAKGSDYLYVYAGDYNWVNIAVNMPETGGTGTFAYTVAYPAGGSAQLKLEPWPLGSAAVINTAVSSGVKGSRSVASGVYFVTVTATAEGKTVTRSEIVHIYQQLTSNANYVFTKLDFGATNLQIGGTIKILIDGQQPEHASIRVNNDWDGEIPVNFTGTDGTGTWSFNLSNLSGADTLNFWVTAINLFEKKLPPVPVPIDDKTDINLGTVAFNTVPLNPNIWTEGSIPSDTSQIISDYYSVDMYRINVSEGQTYYFWMNNRYEGDGSKTAETIMVALYSNGDFIFDTETAWYMPQSFTAERSGTVYWGVATEYWNRTATYAIAYSANRNFHNVMDAAPLAADIWTNGNFPAGTTHWYSVEVSAGQTYYFWMNNAYDGDGTKTAEANMTALYSSGDYIFDTETAWNFPRSFIAAASGTVYLRLSVGYGGRTYAIAYSTNGNWYNGINALPLTVNTWKDGSVPTKAYQTTDWYSVAVSAGTSYYFWINNGYDGDGTKTAYTEVRGYSNGEYIFSMYSNSWSYPSSFTAETNGTIYLRVNASNYYGDTDGTYAIAYSTSSGWNRKENIDITIRTAFNTNGRLSLNYYDNNVTQGDSLNVWVNYDNYYGPQYNSISYEWFIEGVQMVGYTDADVYLPTTGLSPGTYHGMVVVTIDGAAFAQEFPFRVWN